MADTLPAISAFLNSPTGQLATGGAIFYGVQKFFKEVEEKLTEETKFEVAVWLVGLQVAQKVAPWPDTFVRIFDRVFGSKHLSWKCFWRSAVVSITIGTCLLWHEVISGHLQVFPTQPSQIGLYAFIVVGMMVMFTSVANVLPDYISLLETRLVLRCMRRTSNWSLLITLGIADLLFTAVTPILVFGVYVAFLRQFTNDPALSRSFPYQAQAIVTEPAFRTVVIYPAFFTSIWLWLYVGSGLIVKAARHFDIGFNWFHHKFDIEKKPLSAIGLISGAIMALVYWVVVFVGRIV